MNFPKGFEEVQELIKACAEDNLSSCESAATQAVKKIKKMAAYKQLMEHMFYQAVLEMVYDCRHHMNSQLKKQRGDYAKAEKVSSVSSKVANRVAERSIFTFLIAGRPVGEILGGELIGIADAEEARGNGCLFNARLCRVLKPLVPDNKKVKEVVSEKKAKEVFDKLNSAV